MTPPANPARYKHHRFPGDIISHGVWLYYRFSLSYRDVEEMLLARGIMVSHEAVRQWCLKCGQDYANQLKRRGIVNWVDFLERVDTWVPQETETVYAILENLNVHRATDVLLFSLAHPRWEFVFQPTYAAYLNLIEPWWKVLRSLALKGRRFETWEQVCQAIEAATVYWNAHRHPFV